MAADDPVARLWTFFEANLAAIEAAYTDRDYKWLNNALTPLIKGIAPKMNWELGPYHDPDRTFVLAPCTRENLLLSRAAIARAPRIPGWFFEAAKPAKVLDHLTFTACGASVTADQWRYRLTSHNCGEFVDIELFYDEATAPPADHAGLFCELVVEALLGEAMRLERVDFIETCLVDDPGVVENTTAIRYLREHLAEVLAQRH